jgi:hypothetical protein
MPLVMPGMLPPHLHGLKRTFAAWQPAAPIHPEILFIRKTKQ